MTSFPLFINLRLSFSFIFKHFFQFDEWTNARRAIDCNGNDWLSTDSLEGNLKKTARMIDESQIAFFFVCFLRVAPLTKKTVQQDVWRQPDPRVPVWQRCLYIEALPSSDSISKKKKKTSLNTLSFATFFYLISSPNHQQKKNQRSDQQQCRKGKWKTTFFAKITNTRIFLSHCVLLASLGCVATRIKNAFLNAKAKKKKKLLLIADTQKIHPKKQKSIRIEKLEK